MTQFICESKNGTLTLVAQVERTKRQKVKTAFSRWLKDEGEPGKEYQVIEVKSPTIKVKEEKQKVFEGF